LDDLRTIYDYISSDSPLYAERLIDKIVERVEVLKSHPHVGRKVPEFENDNLRELIEGNYRIIYFLESEDKIGIVRIHHSARLLREL
jgi:addiction module RelE/StbE family toxin